MTRCGFLALLLAGFAVPAFAVPFTNLTGIDCECGPSAYIAAAFMTTADYLLTGVELYEYNFPGNGATTVDNYIYSNNTNGLPGTELTSLISDVPAAGNNLFAGVVTSGPPSTPLILMSGTYYWLVVDLPPSIAWGADASSYPPLAIYNGGSTWIPFISEDLQFQINGDPIAPEPGTLGLAALGTALVLLGKRSLRIC